MEFFPNKREMKSGPLVWEDKARYIITLIPQSHSLATCFCCNVDVINLMVSAFDARVHSQPCAEMI